MIRESRTKINRFFHRHKLYPPGKGKKDFKKEFSFHHMVDIVIHRLKDVSQEESYKNDRLALIKMKNKVLVNFTTNERFYKLYHAINFFNKYFHETRPHIDEIEKSAVKITSFIKSSKESLKRQDQLEVFLNTDTKEKIRVRGICMMIQYVLIICGAKQDTDSLIYFHTINSLLEYCKTRQIESFDGEFANFPFCYFMKSAILNCLVRVVVDHQKKLEKIMKKKKKKRGFFASVVGAIKDTLFTSNVKPIEFDKIFSKEYGDLLRTFYEFEQRYYIRSRVSINEKMQFSKVEMINEYINDLTRLLKLLEEKKDDRSHVFIFVISSLQCYLFIELIPISTAIESSKRDLLERFEKLEESVRVGGGVSVRDRLGEFHKIFNRQEGVNEDLRTRVLESTFLFREKDLFYKLLFIIANQRYEPTMPLDSFLERKIKQEHSTDRNHVTIEDVQEMAMRGIMEDRHLLFEVHFRVMWKLTRKQTRIERILSADYSYILFSGNSSRVLQCLGSNLLHRDYFKDLVVHTVSFNRSRTNLRKFVSLMVSQFVQKAQNRTNPVEVMMTELLDIKNTLEQIGRSSKSLVVEEYIRLMEEYVQNHERQSTIRDFIEKLYHPPKLFLEFFGLMNKCGYGEEMTHFRRVFVSWVRRVKSEDCFYQNLVKVKKNYGLIKSLFQKVLSDHQFHEEFPKEGVIIRSIERIERLLSKCDVLRSTSVWLMSSYVNFKGKGKVGNALNSSWGLDVNKTNPREIEDNIEKVENAIGLRLENNQRFFNCVHFFHTNNCAMFEGIVTRKIEKSSTIQKIQNAVKHFLEFMGKIMVEEATIKLSDLSEIDKQLYRLRRSQDIRGDLNLVMRYLRDVENQSLTVVGENTIQDALEYVKYSTSLEDVIQVLEMNKETTLEKNIKNEISDLERIKATMNMMEEKDTLTFRAIGRELQQVKKVLLGVEYFHLQYFSCVQRSGELIKFLRENPMSKEKLSFLRASYVDPSVDSLLTDLKIANDYVTPFLQNRVSLVVLVKEVFSAMKTEKEVKNATNFIDRAASNLRQVRLIVFAASKLDSENLGIMLKEYVFKNGRFVSELPERRDQFPELYLEFRTDEEVQKYNEEKLNEIYRSCIHYQKTKKKSDDIEVEKRMKSDEYCFERFQVLFDISKKFHTQRVEKEFQFCVGKYKATIECSPFSMGSNVENDQAVKKARLLCKEKIAELKLYHEQLEGIFDDFRSLQFFTKKQLVQLLIIFDGEVDVDVAFSYLNYFCKAWRKPPSRLHSEISRICRDYSKRFDRIVQVLEYLSARNIGRDDEDDEEEESYVDEELKKPVRLIDLSKMTERQDEDILYILFEENDYKLPYPFQILWCNEKTTDSDFKEFNKRRKTFPKLTYFFMKVDEIRPRFRETLLLNEVEIQKTSKHPIQTFFVFGSSTGLETFASYYGLPDSPKLERDSCRKEVKKLSKLKRLRFFTGDPLVGKTTTILNELKQRKRIRLSIHESFSPSLFIERYRSEIGNDPNTGIDVFLNIFHTAMSNEIELQKLEGFLFKLVFFGLIEDEQTGELVDISNRDWSCFNLYIELPNLIQNVTDVEGRPSIPTLRLAGTETNVKAEDHFIVCDKTRDVCWLLDKYMKNEHGFLHTVYQSERSRIRSLSDETCRVILKNFFENDSFGKRITNIKHHQKCFVVLMHRYFVFLTKHIIEEHFKSYNTQVQFLASLGKDKLPKNFIKEYQQNGKVNQQNFNDVVQRFFRGMIYVFLEEVSHYSRQESAMELTVPEFVSLPKFSYGFGTWNFDLFTIRKTRTKVEDLKYFSIKEVNEQRSLTENVVAELFRAEERHFRYRIQRNYVLTAEILQKLVMLHERFQAGKNLIFSGMTGCGKTELLKMFSEFLNMSVDVVPTGFMWQNKIVNVIRKNKKVFDELDKDEKNGLRSLEKRFQCICAILERLERVDSPEYPILKKEIWGLMKTELSFYPVVKRTPPIVEIEKISTTDEAFLKLKNEDFVRYMDEFVEAKIERDFFITLIEMHQGMSSSELKRRIRMVKEKTEKRKKLVEAAAEKMRRTRRSNPKAPKYEYRHVVFVDETNTTSIMGMVKELFIDHTIDGNPLPKWIMFTGCINPFEKAESSTDQEVEEEEDEGEMEEEITSPAEANVISSAFGYTGKTYLVNEMPPSMNHLIVPFEDIEGENEAEFIHLYLILNNYRRIDEGKKSFGERTMKNLFSMIQFGQRFIRGKGWKRVKCSIRDIIRACTYYNFFFEFFRDKPGQMRTYYATTWMMIVAYYFRTKTSAGERGYYQSSRREFENALIAKLRIFFETEMRSYPFDKVMNEVMKEFAEQLHIPKYIAKTRSFLENVFCSFVCIMCNTPLIQCGPPGCSKTLSVRVITENMKGSSSKSPFFRDKRSTETFVHQCQADTSSNELKHTFVRALAHQNKIDASKKFDELGVVVLDESGLLKEKRHALKVIHYYLDHPKVCTLLLSNSQLDAAKTNRCSLLNQIEPDIDELFALSCTVFGMVEKSPDDFTDAFLRGLCRAFQEVNNIKEDRPINVPMFHLRDFHYFLRLFKDRVTQKGSVNLQGDIEMTTKHLEYALQRNFNGKSRQNMENILNLFKNHIQTEINLRKFGITIRKENEILNTIDLFRDSMEDKQPHGEDPNVSHFRYIMMIDKTTVQSSVKLSEDIGLIDDTFQLIEVSDFDDDDTNYERSKVISEIKEQLSRKDAKILLLNSEKIHTNFYDLFNRYFVIYENDENYYANISDGSHRAPCPISPNCKIIVHVTQEGIDNRLVPLPLLNRFEKYVVSFDGVTKFQIEKKATELGLLPDSIRKVYNTVRDGCRDFVSNYVRKEAFYGYVEDLTIDSLMFKALVESDKHQFMIPKILHPGLELEEEKEEEEREKGVDFWNDPAFMLQDVIRQFNFFLLQVARTHTFYIQRKVFKREYLEEYLVKQHHMTVENFLQEFLDFYFVKSKSLKKPLLDRRNKWIIYTRKSSEITLFSSQKYDKDGNTVQNEYAKAFTGRSEAILNIANLAQMDTQEKCENTVKTFASRYVKNPKNCSVFVANTATVTKNQINKLRNLVGKYFKKYWNQGTSSRAREDGEDEEEEEEGEEEEEEGEEDSDEEVPSTHTPPVVIIIIHFPPHKINLKSTYDTIYLNNWNYLYSDIFSASSRGKILEEKEQRVLVERVKHNLDHRFWFRAAFGLVDEEELSKTRIRKDFSTIFQDIIDQLCQKIAPSGVEASMMTSECIRLWEKVGEKEWDIAISTTKVFLSNLFERHPFIKNAILGKFALNWKHKLLSRILMETCVYIQKGSFSQGISQIIFEKLQFYLVGLVQYYLMKIINYYNFVSIVEACRSRTGSTLVEHMFEDIEIPGLEEIEELYEHKTIIQFSQDRSPFHTPFFLLLEETMERVTSKLGVDTNYRSFEETKEKMKFEVEKQKFLERVPGEMERSRIFMDQLLDDLICYYLDLNSTPEDSYFEEKSKERKKIYINKKENVMIIVRKLMLLRTRVDDPGFLDLHLFFLLFSTEVKDVVDILLNHVHVNQDLEDTIEECESFEQIRNYLLQVGVGSFLEIEDFDSLLPNDDHDQYSYFNDDLLSWLENVQSLALRFKSSREGTMEFEGNEDHVYHLMIFPTLFDVLLEGDTSVSNYKNLKNLRGLGRHMSLEDLVVLVKRRFPSKFVKWKDAVMRVYFKTTLLFRSRSINRILFILNSVRDSNHCLKDPHPRIIGSFLRNIVQKRTPQVLLDINDMDDIIGALFPDGYDGNFHFLDKSTWEGVEFLFFNTYLHVTKRNLEVEGISASLQNVGQVCDELLENFNRRNLDHVLKKNVLEYLTIEGMSERLSDESLTIRQIESDHDIFEKGCKIFKSLCQGSAVVSSAAFQKLFYGITTKKRLCEVLKSRRLLQRFGGYPTWHHMKDFVKVPSFTQFPFQRDRNSVYSQLVKIVKRNNNENGHEVVIQFIRQHAVSNVSKYEIRMYLLLSLFHNFYLQVRLCKVIPNVLRSEEIKNLLFLTEDEVQVYFKFCIPPPDPPYIDNDGLHEIFSRNFIRNNKDELDNLNLIVNMLAVTLGSPRDKLHMYPRIFNLGSISRTVPPGAVTHMTIMDCGFKTKQDGSMVLSPHVFDGNQGYHGLCNFFTWASMGLSVYFFNRDKTNSNLQFMNSSIFNYLQDMRGFSRLQSQEQRSIMYVMGRAYSFLQNYRISDLIVRNNFDPQFFATQVLYLVWNSVTKNLILDGETMQFVNDTSNSHNNARSLTSGTQKVHYENFLKNVGMMKVTQFYHDLMRLHEGQSFQRGGEIVVAEDGECIIASYDVKRVEAIKKKNDLFTEFLQFVEYDRDLSNEHSLNELHDLLNHLTEDEIFRNHPKFSETTVKLYHDRIFISDFMGFAKKEFITLPHLTKLVEFEVFMVDVLSDKLTEKEANTLSLREALIKVGGLLGRTEEFLGRFEEFAKSYNFCGSLVELGDCHHAMEVAAQGAFDFYPLTNETPLNTLYSVKLESGDVLKDRLRLLMRAICRCQNRLLPETSEKFSIYSLPKIRQRGEVMIECFDFSDIEDYVMSTTPYGKVLKFDLGEIRHFFTREYLRKRKVLDYENGVPLLKYKSEDEEEKKNVDKIKTVFELSFSLLTQRLPKIYREELQAEIPSVTELEDVMSYLMKLMERLIEREEEKQDEEIEKIKPLNQRELTNDFLVYVSRKKACFLHSICKEVMNHFYFSEKKKKKFDQFPEFFSIKQLLKEDKEVIERNLNIIKNPDSDDEEVNLYRKTIECVSDMLFDLDAEKMSEYETLRIRNTLDEQFQLLENQEILNKILPLELDITWLMCCDLLKLYQYYLGISLLRLHLPKREQKKYSEFVEGGRFNKLEVDTPVEKKGKFEFGDDRQYFEDESFEKLEETESEEKEDVEEVEGEEESEEEEEEETKSNEPVFNCQKLEIGLDDWEQIQIQDDVEEEDLSEEDSSEEEGEEEGTGHSFFPLVGKELLQILNPFLPPSVDEKKKDVFNEYKIRGKDFLRKGSFEDVVVVDLEGWNENEIKFMALLQQQIEMDGWDPLEQEVGGDNDSGDDEEKGSQDTEQEVDLIGNLPTIELLVYLMKNLPSIRLERFLMIGGYTGSELTDQEQFDDIVRFLADGGWEEGEVDILRGFLFCTEFKYLASTSLAKVLKEYLPSGMDEEKLLVFKKHGVIGKMFSTKEEYEEKVKCNLEGWTEVEIRFLDLIQGQVCKFKWDPLTKEMEKDDVEKMDSIDLVQYLRRRLPNIPIEKFLALEDCQGDELADKENFEEEVTENLKDDGWTEEEIKSLHGLLFSFRGYSGQLVGKLLFKYLPRTMSEEKISIFEKNSIYGSDFFGENFSTSKVVQNLEGWNDVEKKYLSLIQDQLTRFGWEPKLSEEEEEEEEGEEEEEKTVVSALEELGTMDMILFLRKRIKEVDIPEVCYLELGDFSGEELADNETFMNDVLPSLEEKWKDEEVRIMKKFLYPKKEAEFLKVVRDYLDGDMNPTEIDFVVDLLNDEIDDLESVNEELIKKLEKKWRSLGGYVVLLFGCRNSFGRRVVVGKAGTFEERKNMLLESFKNHGRTLPVKILERFHEANVTPTSLTIMRGWGSSKVSSDKLDKVLPEQLFMRFFEEEVRKGEVNVRNVKKLVGFVFRKMKNSDFN